MSLTVTPVATADDLKLFTRLPRLLYAGMPGYVPPLDLDRAMMLDPKKSPFFAHGEAGYFIARRDGRPVGRISAQLDRLATGPQHDGIGQFGCLDAVDDPDAVAALTRAAEAWLGARGRHTARGPFLLTINSETGVLIEEAAGAPPMTLIPWHPGWLAGHLEAAGYAITRRIHSYDVDLAAFDYERIIASRGLARARGGLTARLLDPKNLARDVDIARRLFDDAWSGNYAFVPLAKPEIDLMAREYKPFLRPENAVFIEKDGEPLAFTLALPNLFEITADVGPSPNPIGFGKLAWRAFTHRFRHVRFALFGVASRHRDTAFGAMIAARALAEHLRIGQQAGFTRVEAGWVLEENEPVNRLLATLGFVRYRTHAITERRFA